MKRLWIVIAVSVGGCMSPTAPTDCLDADLEHVHARLEGVRMGDPDYADAVRWSTTCPGWGLLSD